MAKEREHKVIEIEKKEVVFTLPIVKAPHWLQGFVDFIREQDVVSVSVGLILGLAAKSLIDSLVGNIFNPIVGIFTGGTSLQDKALCIKTVDGVCTDSLNYGQFFSNLISFIIILALVYFVIKGLKLDKLEKKKKSKKVND
jgi:large conductance mechanosensitive channel